MRSRIAVPIAVVLVVIASGLVASVLPPTAAATPVPTVAPRPAATGSIQATNAYGSVVSSFSTGYANGKVFFSAYDPVDTSATVTLTDGNATRDGLTNPVATWTASFSAGPYNESYLYDIGYLLPLDLSYGGNWTLTLMGANAGNASTTFFVHTYYADLTTTAPMYLPGASGTGLLWIGSTANGGPYNLATETILGEYETSTGYAPLFASALTFSNTHEMSFNFSVPLDAAPGGGLYLVLYANETNPGRISETASTGASVGNLSAPSLVLGDCPSPTNCGATSFVENSPVFLAVSEELVAPFTSAPGAGLSIQLQFVVNGLSVSVPDVPLNLTTNATGGASVVFLAASSTFSFTKPNEVIATVSDPGNPSLGSVAAHVNFTLARTSLATPVLQVSFDSLQYFGGDTATVTWQLGGLNASAAQGWNVSDYEIDGLATGTVLGWGTINSSATQGTFTFAIPLHYSGTVQVWVDAYNRSSGISDYADATVTAPTILLNPSELYYLPGDSVTVQVTTQGSVFSGTTLYDSVVTSSGYQLAAGTLSGSSIAFTVPTTGAPSSIAVSVAAQSGTLGIVSSATVSLSEASGYQLLAGVSTASQYVDGSYQPGQTIHLSYQLLTIGPTPLPKSFELYAGMDSAFYYGSPVGTVYSQITSASGSVAFTIPSNVPAGSQSLVVEVIGALCGYYSCGGATSFSINIEPHPSALGYELGAGSGLTVGWLVLLVLIVLVALAVLLIARRGRGGSGRSPPRAEGVKPFTPGAGSSGGTGSGGSAAWRETESGGAGGSEPSGSGSPPPMPQAPHS